MDFNEWNPFWATCFSVMAFLIIVGNSLTIATLLRKKFRKRPQFLLISLAFADLLVGCANTLYVIVLTMYRLFAYRLFALSFAFDMLDLLAGLSSIFHLAVISLERLHATLRPFRHRQLSLKAYWVAIATPWVLSSSVSTLMLTRFRGMQHGVALIIVIICLTTPLLITCFSYLAIWRKRRINPEIVRSFRQNQEARFSKSIFLVTAASFLTWTPFLVVHIIVLVTVYLRIPLFVFFCIVLVHFSNSFVNFIIYIIRFPSYRKALFSLCRCSVL